MPVTLIIAAAVIALCAAAGVASDRTLVFVGTSPSKPEEAGVYLTEFDPKTGALSEPKLAVKARRPSFITVHPARPYLYACNETSDTAGRKTGSVIGFGVDDRAVMLTPINIEVSKGMGPCYVEVEPSGKTLLVANYGSGSVASLPVDPATGKISPAATADQHHGAGPNAKRQDGPHAHTIRVDPTGRFALSCDLGTDQIYIYRLGDDSTLTPANPATVSVAPGAGPRHLAFSRDGKFVYVGTELGNTVIAFAWDGQAGTMRQIQTISTLPPGYTSESYVAEVTTSADGRFLYVSNRGHDSIAVFAIDATTGKLDLRSHASTLGKFPRHFAIDPSGQFMIVANQNSSDMFVFRIDPADGSLTATGAKVNIPAPTCVLFWPARAE